MLTSPLYGTGKGSPSLHYSAYSGDHCSLQCTAGPNDEVLYIVLGDDMSIYYHHNTYWAGHYHVNYLLVDMINIQLYSSSYTCPVICISIQLAALLCHPQHVILLL